MKQESTQEKVAKINNYVKQFDYQVIPYQLCEVCFKPKNLIICEVCKNYFHMKCLEMKEIPFKFQCYNCKDFTKSDFKTPQMNSIHEPGKTLTKSESENTLPNYKETRKLRKDINTGTNAESTSKENINQEPEKRVIKPRKKRINNFEDAIKLDKYDRRDLLSFENLESHYKKRKVRLGTLHNIDIREYHDKIENEFNIDELDHERKDLKKVYSCDMNPLSEVELDNYIKKARMFWNYRNINVENELCADFFQDLDEYIKDNKVKFYYKSSKINGKVDSLKKFLMNGITFNAHFDEMAFKILHICKYKTNVALLFLLKGLNPFIEEIEEGFKSDVTFFQKEILSILSDDEN